VKSGCVSLLSLMDNFTRDCCYIGRTKWKSNDFEFLVAVVRNFGKRDRWAQSSVVQGVKKLSAREFELLCCRNDVESLWQGEMDDAAKRELQA